MQVGDVLLAKDGNTLGITNIVEELPSAATVNSSIAVIRPSENLNSKYLYYYLLTNYIQHIIQRFKDGMGVPHLFQKDINKFYIVKPSMEVQEKIVEYLEPKIQQIDKMVLKSQEIINKLKEYRQSLITEVVTGKIDVRDEPEAMMEPHETERNEGE
ncbi:Type I restriction modification DNA specificity domain-containing protein [Salibacterium qingdaonense]|uniref:Type I restriction modification DNA specificity domain-containing protein n=1 Tax=Salibacterium qingdaonense TaxID=266892 RepID=A0A1I4R322_9BACI|nr:Type I restriction modification DNA specificity domain-containing protein [Salibacterium qingdaonense]